MNANEPAFPEPYINDPHLALSNKPGLTKREYFAAMALSGLCVPGALQLPTDYPYVADKCVRIADELIKQLADGRPR